MSSGIYSASWDEMELANSFPLHRACKEGDVQTVIMLLQSNPGLAGIEDRFFGWTPAHWAAYFGKLDCLRNVMAVVPNGVNMQNSKMCISPAHCAAEAGHSHCLLWLLQAGANPNLKDCIGETPLHKASRAGKAECVSLLIESSGDVRITNNSGQSASALAENCGYHDIASYIHKAELVRELGGKFHSRNSQTSNGFHQYLQNGINGFGCPTLNNTQFSRKRSFDSANRDGVKRTRMEVPPTGNIEMATPTINGTLNSAFTPLLPVTSSVIEHEKLCRMERGYTNSLLECMINQFHGC